MIPTLKKTSACDNISPLLLGFRLRQPRTTDDLGPANQRTIHITKFISRNRDSGRSSPVSVIASLKMKGVSLS